MSSKAETEKINTAKKAIEEKKQESEILEILEDDDEFEDFEQNGKLRLFKRSDWDEEMEEEEDIKQWYACFL